MKGGTIGKQGKLLGRRREKYREEALKENKENGRGDAGNVLKENKENDWRDAGIATEKRHFRKIRKILGEMQGRVSGK